MDYKYDEKDLPAVIERGIPVISPKYGKGKVKNSDFGQIGVQFDNGELHAFVYPSCFLLGILDFDFKYPEEYRNYFTTVSIDDDDSNLEFFRDGGEAQDSVEDTPEYKAIEEQLEKEIIAEVGEGGYLGYCHLYWMAKKRILKEKYGIDWKSPAELNPHVMYD